MKLLTSTIIAAAASDNSTLNGKALYSCHEGAALEGLCVASSPPKPANNISETFNFNYTNSQPNYGLLTWELIGGNFKGSPTHPTSTPSS